MQGTTCPDIENVFDFWNFPYLINSLTSKCLKFLFKYWIYLRSWYMIISNPFKKFSRAMYLKCILIALRDTKLIVYGNSILKSFLRYGERHHWLDGRESEWTLGVGDVAKSRTWLSDWTELNHSTLKKIMIYWVSYLKYLEKFMNPPTCKGVQL